MWSLPGGDAVSKVVVKDPSEMYLADNGTVEPSLRLFPNGRSLTTNIFFPQTIHSEPCRAVRYLHRPVACSKVQRHEC